MGGNKPVRETALKKIALRWIIAFAVMSLLPFFVPHGWLRVLIIANFLAIFAMSWDIMSGYTGYISFGHNFLLGISAYASVLLIHHFDVPLYLSMPIGVLIAAVGGVGFVLPTLRVRGPYFTLFTLGLFILFERIMITLGPITGGTRGLFGFPTVLKGAVPNFYLTLVLVFAVAFALWYLGQTDFGRVLNAIRLDEDVVENSGLDTTRFKLLSFLMSSIAAGIGAVFFIHYLGALCPRSVFAVFLLLNIIIASVIGGMGTIIGPFMGAYIITIILEGLRAVAPGPWRIATYAAIGLIIFILRPRGIFFEIQRLFRRRR
ncbi:MAG: hypothetical protein DRO43_01585 [Candidatus Hecatellales archaeon]|nr:MAG: hypothetical protein DRO43_01585 [Candidatus Hecatellales archaeon]